MDYSKWLLGGGKVLNSLILAAININLTDFLHNAFVYAFNPYTSIFGNLTWGFIFGFIGAGVYVGSKSIPTIFSYLVIVGLIFSIILPDAIIAIFGILLAFIGTSILYATFVKS